MRLWTLFVPAMLLVGSCGSMGPFELSPEPKLTIRVTGLRYIESQKQFIGLVEIQNRAEQFRQLSNQELFVYWGKDSARAYMKMPGEWQIDQGLINVVSGKTVTYQACWPAGTLADTDDVKIKYVKHLNREQALE